MERKKKSMREDEDLKFLGKVLSEDLNTLVAIITTDKDGKKRMTEGLTDTDLYKKHHPNHTAYWQDIAREVQLFGGNSISNLLRGGTGVAYEEILKDICKTNKVKLSDSMSIIDIESELLLKIFESSLDGLDNKQREELLKELKISSKDLSEEAIIIAVQAALKNPLIFKMLSNLIAKSVLKALTGKGIQIVGQQTLAKGVSVLTGPIGWGITAGWTALELAGPAVRVTMPAVLEIIFLRQKTKTKMYKFKYFCKQFIIFKKI